MDEKKIVLNGKWKTDYLTAPLKSHDVEKKVADAEADAYECEKEPAVSDEYVMCPVPGYWEDMVDLFRTTPLHSRLRWNPLYTVQRYPQAGYVPDMALPNVVGTFVYQRTFILEEEEKNAVLWIGGVQNSASAWINGCRLGHHEGYSSDFSFDIPEGVLKRGENRVTLAVSNLRLKGYRERPVSGLTSRAANECTGGIYGDVELRFYPDGLRDLWVTTAEDLSAFTVHIEGSEERNRKVTIRDGKQTIFEKEISEGETEAVFPTEGLTMWSPEMPKRYTVSVETEGQQMEQLFGIRRLTAQGNRLFLNGAPFFFRGVCEHCYHPITVHPTRDKTYYRRNIRVLKELGFNAIRFHTYVPMAEYMEAADELGMVMEIETPNNTHENEWRDIIRMTRRYTAPMLYSSGNEMTIDEEYVEHLRRCAGLVHTQTDALFSPMSAMRSVEYAFKENDETIDQPFQYNPKRLEQLSEFCDVYNTYSLGATSYHSDSGDAKTLDERNAVYGKPLLSHEIGINGTYIDLSLKERYRGSRIGDTELFTSVERHLAEKRLLDRANLYYRNSVKWQSLLRKACFETTRRAESFAGYDFLGDIDTHWHTFGYCVGMMNEFYELKAGETVENIRRYNSAAVLLADLPKCRNFITGIRTEIPIMLSNYQEALKDAVLTLCLSDGDKVYVRRLLNFREIRVGGVFKLYQLAFMMPRVEKPTRLKLMASLFGGNMNIQNEWELYVFPKLKKAVKAKNLTVTTDMSKKKLLRAMERGKRVLLLGAGPFPKQPISFQIALAGRTNGHLATVVKDHPLLDALPHDGFCGWQFREMINGGCSAVLDHPDVPYEPIIESATSYKNARPEALMFEYRVGEGRLLVSTLDLKADDPGACWLKERLIDYASGELFEPDIALSLSALSALLEEDAVIDDGDDTNEAANKNDITMS